MMERQTPLTGPALLEYIKKKRLTTGQVFTWSDGVIFEAMAEVLGRPIMQLTYPRYRDGDPQPDLRPVFSLSKCGNREKLPIFVHYNGINHYNCFVPKAYPKQQPIAAKSAGGAFGGMFAGLDDAPVAPPTKKTGIAPAR